MQNAFAILFPLLCAFASIACYRRAIAIVRRDAFDVVDTHSTRIRQ